jgi:hypothetical protein
MIDFVDSALEAVTGTELKNPNDSSIIAKAGVVSTTFPSAAKTTLDYVCPMRYHSNGVRGADVAAKKAMDMWALGIMCCKALSPTSPLFPDGQDEWLRRLAPDSSGEFYTRASNWGVVFGCKLLPAILHAPPISTLQFTPRSNSPLSALLSYRRRPVFGRYVVPRIY